MNRCERNASRGRVFSRCAFVAATLAVLFSAAVIAAQAQTFTVLHRFSFTDGAGPQSRLAFDKAGNLYGTASEGGMDDLDGGTAFKLSQKNGNWTFSLLYSFYQNGADAAAPRAVVVAPDGSLYGSSRSGGGIGLGTLSRLQPPATFCASFACPWLETVIYRFAGHNDGCDPQNIILDSSGNILGATADDLCSGWGRVYELSPSGNGWTKNLLYTFTGGDGALPNSVLAMDGAGNLYSTTEFSSGSGKSYLDYGTVYQLASGTGWIHTTLHSFTNQTDGAFPGGVTLDSAGDVLGVTPWGGSNGTGTLFELTPDSGGWAFNAFFNFTGPSHCGPDAPLTMDSQGNFYGVTGCDGSLGYGNVFKLTPSGDGWVYTDLHDFTGGPDGADPAAAVVLDASGNIYGTADSGGNNQACDGGCGVIWEITP